MQASLWVCISGVEKATSPLLLRESAGDIVVFECLSDACRLFANSVHDETVIRKSRLLVYINTMRRMLSPTAVDDSLSVKNLPKILKTA